MNRSEFANAASLSGACFALPTWQRRGRGLLTGAFGLVVALALTVAHPGLVSAHPLGNFTVNQYSRIEVTSSGVQIVYVLDLAELPTFQERPRIDTDGDEQLSELERAAYVDAKLAEVVSTLHLSAGGAELPLRVVERELTFLDGQAGLPTSRLRAVLATDEALPATAAPQDLAFRNDYATDRLGWREIVVTHGAGVRLDRSDAPLRDVSNELRVYPDDLLSSPLDQRAASFAVSRDSAAPAAGGFVATDADAGARPETVGTIGRLGGINDRLATLIDGGDLSLAGIALALLAALVWGAVHALSPGHGKTVVGAYLVGARGTARHALFLGATVTITHTAGVLALGLVALFASRYVVPEQLFPWFSLASGVLVVVMGLSILRQRVRGLPTFGHHSLDHDHDHDHNHDHDHHHDHHHHDEDHSYQHSHGGHTHSHLPPGADGSAITWRGLLALGVSGGLLPCPSALLALLGAIALGRAGFGLLLVIAFSLGLAGTLTGVGLLFLYAGRFLERRAPANRVTTAVLRYAPVGGALGVTVAGVAIVLRALTETRLL